MRIFFYGLIFSLSLTILSCGTEIEEEKDNYVTTELNGLYRYNSVYKTETCNSSEYKIDASEKLVQPYFMLEGEKYDETGNIVKLYYCEDLDFDTCLKTQNGIDLKKIFAKGIDGNWTLLPLSYTNYDQVSGKCSFYKETEISHKFTGKNLTIERKLMYYSEKLSISECNITKIENKKLKCLSKIKYKTRKELISERDLEYFENKENREDQGI